jgi:hypothetical protein
MPPVGVSSDRTVTVLTSYIHTTVPATPKSTYRGSPICFRTLFLLIPSSRRIVSSALINGVLYVLVNVAHPAKRRTLAIRINFFTLYIDI